MLTLRSILRENREVKSNLEPLRPVPKRFAEIPKSYAVIKATEVLRKIRGSYSDDCEDYGLYGM
jgi:hypothetical protein